MSTTIERPDSDAYGRLDVTIRETSFEAGRTTPVAILLRNPLDVPVEVIEIRGPRSFHVREISHESSDIRPVVTEASTNSRSRGVFWNVFRALRSMSFTEISIGGVKAKFPGDDKILNITSDDNADILIPQDFSDYYRINLSVGNDAKIRFEPQNVGNRGSTSADIKTFTIEPHCEAVAYFEISTAGWLLFTPTRQTLSTQVKYQIAGKQKSQVTTSEFEVKPPLASMVIGAILGAISGSVAKILNGSPTVSFQSAAVAVGGSIVMSLIAAITLSRKTGTQGFITVEDFFGGFVVGALIGYGGSSYFEKSLHQQDPATAATKGLS